MWSSTMTTVEFKGSAQCCIHSFKTIMALRGHGVFGIFCSLRHTSPCTVWERWRPEINSTAFLSEIQSSLVVFSQIVIDNLNSNTLTFQRCYFSWNNGKGFLKYNSNKLYILYRILLFLFQFSLLYKNNTFQAIHSFTHVQTKTSCRTCETGFWECSSGCWAATREQRSPLLSLERAVNGQARPNSVSSLAVSSAHIPVLQPLHCR